MNHKALTTVFWGQWRKNRWLLLAILGSIAAAYALLGIIDQRGLRENAGNPAEDFLVALLLISVPSLVAAAAVLLGHSDSERLHIALPPRVLRLPLTTSKLVGVFLAFGVFVAVGISTAATIPAIFMLNVDFPWWAPVLTAVMATAFLQLWAYTFGNASPRVALLSFTLCFALFAWVARRPALVQLTTEGGSVIAVLLVAAQLAVVFALAVWVTTILRGGGWAGRFGILNPASTIVRRKRRPFRSKRAAQFWYEWRLFGSLLPVYVSGVAIAYFFGLPLVIGIFRISDTTGNSSAEGIEALFSISWFTSAQFVTTGITLSAVIGAVIVSGIMFMRAGHWNSQSDFLLTRPLSIQRIATARISMMFASTAVAFLLFLVSLAAVTALLNATGETLSFVSFLHQGYEHLPAAYPLAFFWGGVFLILWMASWSINSVWVLCILALVHAPPIAAIWSLALLGTLSITDAQTISYAAVYICNWIASAILLAGLLWMAYQSEKKRIIPAHYTWIAALLWITYSGAFYYFVGEWDIPPSAKEWAIRFPNPVNWSIWIGVSALPLTPLFLQPLLLEHARHR